MVNLGQRHCKLLGDGWTVITKDKKPSAQFEHTILITDSGHEILTIDPDDKEASLTVWPAIKL
jgi:methionyl aminopeptidase